MVKTDKSKRGFFKKMAAVIGFFAAASTFGKLTTQHNNSNSEINNKYAKDIDTQKKAWMQKQMVVMTNDEKKQMLDELLGNNKNANS